MTALPNSSLHYSSSSSPTSHSLPQWNRSSLLIADCNYSTTVTMEVAAVTHSSDHSLPGTLSSTTPILGLKLYILLIIALTLLIALFLLVFYFLRSNRSLKRCGFRKQCSEFLPITEIKCSNRPENCGIGEIKGDSGVIGNGKLGVMLGMKVVESEKGSSESNISAVSHETSSSGEGMNIGWGRWYTLKELDAATGGFSDENVVGRGGYGIVYRGVLPDGSVIAVKNLFNNRGQAEKEFTVEVEAIGKVRHKNLVGLIGYAAEGANRLLVYEYVDNGNLERWLHGDVGPVSPLTWDIRMKIAIGTAKGLAYLHEGLEPKVVHRDVKSSNILLDRKWNAKVSDFGLAKLLGPEKTYVTTRVMGTFGYVSPEYASTGMLNEWSDVYSFGVLLMELITAQSPIDYSRAPGEINLVEWFKGMVLSRRGEEVLDPLIQEKPSPRALKRVLLVCLRCIDKEASKRPKMGQIVHMLEGDEFPYRSDPRTTKETAPLRSHSDVAQKVLVPSKQFVVGRHMQRS